MARKSLSNIKNPSQCVLVVMLDQYVINDDQDLLPDPIADRAPLAVPTDYLPLDTRDPDHLLADLSVDHLRRAADPTETDAHPIHLLLLCRQDALDHHPEDDRQ